MKDEGLKPWARNWKFESYSLQRRVACEPDFRGRMPWGAKAVDCLPRGVAPGRAGLFSLIFVRRQSTALGPARLRLRER
jgi:hypothetical protein